MSYFLFSSKHEYVNKQINGIRLSQHYLLSP